MAELTKDRPAPLVAEGKAWAPVDRRGVLPASDQAKVDRMGEAVEHLVRIHRQLPATLYMVRESMAGQPSNPGGTGPTWNWCKDHERSTKACDAEGLLCKGEPDVRSDPTGNAAVINDIAKRDYRDLLRLAELVDSTARRMLGLEETYPTERIDLEEIEPDDEVGSKYCRACFKDNNDLTLVTLRAKTNEPYYVGLCRWCGLRAAELGGDPPTWMVAKHHRGDRVTPGDMARAKKVYDEIKARSTTKSNKRKKGKRK